MFYTTDISVTLWILNRNKKARTTVIGGESRQYRDRTGEILFMDLRTWGEPFEKKFVRFSDADIKKAALRFHQWQRTDLGEYHDEAEFCKSMKIEDLKDYSLVPGKYIEFKERDESIGYEERMSQLQSELTDLFREEKRGKKAVMEVFKKLGYEISVGDE